MSTTKAQLESFAKQLLEHDALEAVRERVRMRLFNRFCTSNAEEREIVNDLMAAENLFFSELKSILGEADAEGSVNDDGEDEDKNN